MKDCRSIIWQAFIQKLALWLYGYWVLGIGLPGYTNHYMVDILHMPRPNRLIYTYMCGSSRVVIYQHANFSMDGDGGHH